MEANQQVMLGLETENTCRQNTKTGSLNAETEKITRGRESEKSGVELASNGKINPETARHRFAMYSCETFENEVKIWMIISLPTLNSPDFEEVALSV